MSPANILTFILSTSLATPNTIIPFFTSDAAIPAPIPELAPVTNATLPHQRSMTYTMPLWTVCWVQPSSLIN